jgi:RimJ/RimL family protein N-acetyltransferase
MRTERLVMRQWRPADREPFAALNADPELTRRFPSTMCRERSNEFVDRTAALARDGYGLWVREVIETGGFIGWPASRWGHGHATEAARARAEFPFTELGLPELVSFTVPANLRSQTVMRRIGTPHDPAGHVDHPRLPPGHPLRRHVLNRLPRPWASAS